MRIMKYVHYVYYCLLCRPPVWNSKQWTLIGIHGIPNAVQIRSRQASCPVPPLVEFGVPFKFSVNSIFWSLIVLYHLSDATCWMPFWFAAREAQSYTAEVEQSGCSRDIDSVVGGTCWSYCPIQYPLCLPPTGIVRHSPAHSHMELSI